jgi:hypothetical protein
VDIPEARGGFGEGTMSWKAPFVVFRFTPAGTVEEVYEAEHLEAARYWLMYIAEAGDVLCRTPSHPRHSKKGKQPEYWSHKETSGTIRMDEAVWRQHVESLTRKAPEFPSEPLVEQPNR